MTAQAPLFNLSEGERRKHRGQNLAASKHAELLLEVQNAMREIAAVRPDRCVTSDDAHQYLKVWEYKDTELGNGMGRVFNSRHWESVGFVKSKRPAARARMIRVWRLK